MYQVGLGQVFHLIPGHYVFVPGIQLESGFNILLEDGSPLLLE